MDKSKQVVEARIKYLEELARNIQERKATIILTRLAEAKEILILINEVLFTERLK